MDFGSFEYLFVDDFESIIFWSGSTTSRDIGEFVSLSVIGDDA